MSSGVGTRPGCRQVDNDRQFATRLPRPSGHVRAEEESSMTETTSALGDLGPIVLTLAREPAPERTRRWA